MKEEVSFCGKIMIIKGLSLAFAESATAGRMAAEFSLVENAGKFLKGGLVCYDACLKESILKVPSALIEKFSPESAEVTQAITVGLSTLIAADIYVGVTGLTTPGGSETKEKPVGTMFLHGIYDKQTIFSKRMLFSGSPEEIVVQSITATAILIKDELSGI